MEKIYLVRNGGDNDTNNLTAVTAEEYQRIVLSNENLPADEMRHFIILPGRIDGKKYLVYWETTRKNAMLWHSDKERRRSRDKLFRNNVPICSLDALVESEYGGCIATDHPLMDMDTGTEVKDRLERLTGELLTHEHGECEVNMVQMYTEGRKRDCASVLAERYGKCAKTIRNYRDSLDDFLAQFYKQEGMHN